MQRPPAGLFHSLCFPLGLGWSGSGLARLQHLFLLGKGALRHIQLGDLIRIDGWGGFQSFSQLKAK